MRTIGALIFPGFELLDVFGPMEMFGLLSKDYELNLIAEHKGAIPSGQKLAAVADHSISDRSGFDILFIPGGAGTRREVENPHLLTWIEKTAYHAEFVLSVCTGSALLAKTGILDNKHATTNKAAFKVVSQGPKVNWVRQARWIEDGKTLTSSGVSAGMDMSLGAISIMHGIERARKVAMWSEYDWHEDSNWDPFAKVHGLV
ncbi:DJ-1/PfpI family protein [Kiloniella litopenaei]|uniref:DJ-1/PfpI family protein n=1 Tax=Kiloniella litopenaei TaxID=1549748 RepID=UPI003BA853A6